MSSRHSIRIFLASPKDTAEARQGVADVVEAIAHDPAYRERVEIELRRWDDPNRPVPLSFRRNPQADVVEYTGDPSDCDLLVALFRHVFGSPLPEKDEGRDYGLSPDGDPWTGTEWEISQALQAGREVWIWRDKTEWIADSGWSRQERDARYQQYNRVLEFIDECKDETGTIRRGVLEYGSAEQLKKELDGRLRAWISHRSAPSPRADDLPSEDPAAARARRVQDHLDTLIDRLAQHEPRYVPLSGTETAEQRLERVLKDVVMPSDVVFEAFGFETGCGGGRGAAVAQEPVAYADVLDAYRALPQRGTVRRLAVLGEPGAGKSFSLGRIACELARRARADAAQPVPVLVALGLWTDPDEPLEAFIARCSLPPPPKGSAPADITPRLLPTDLQVLRAEGRLLLLLDAVNEIPPGQRRDKAEAIAALAQDGHLAALVLSCRQRDFEAELQSRLPFDTLRLLPLRPWQVRDFLRQTLVLAHGEADGARRAEDKFWQIAGGEALRATWQVWAQAGASFELFWTAEDVPHENPNVVSMTTGEQEQLWYAARDNRRSLMRLAENPFRLFVMMQLPTIPPNRAQLFGGFLKVLHRRESALRSADGSVPPLPAWRAVLVQVAEALQQADGWAGDDGARTALARADWPAALTDEMLTFSIDASVLQLVGDELRFTHQLLQESLAADVLLNTCRDGRQSARDFWPTGLGWARTGWEVVAEIAAEACEGDPPALVGLIGWLAETAPKVAADVWHHAGQPPLPAALLVRTKAQWFARMTDIRREPDPVARAAIGCWLGRLGLDDRSGIGLRPDGLPDIDWVEFNDGRPFVYQKAEHPGLPPFALSRYLVTHRQFQAFVEAPDGYADLRWWQGFEEQHAAAPRPARWPEPNCPRETVTWFESVAFCRWLSMRLGEEIRLPHEREWERAARGHDGWQYPSADLEYPVGHANGNESRLEGGNYLRRTCAVGLYPQGATREGGLLDMAGNVWEWCSDAYASQDESKSMKSTIGRVLRGGSWERPVNRLRMTIRNLGRPDFGYFSFGFRICRPSSSLYAASSCVAAVSDAID